MYIDIKDISYRINSCDILTNINFQANTGEIISILGSNGAGKSTLLKLIAGDFTPTSGDILFDKKCLSNISIAERAKIRSVMSSPIDIPFNYTVLDIMEMGKDSVMVIHGGGIYGDKEGAIERWCENYEELPDKIKKRLVLEN